MLRKFNARLLQLSNNAACTQLVSKLPLCTSAPIEDANKKVVSKAMKAYLERAKEHDEFMAQKNLEFQIGKRHLANMMGENPETFTQEDVDNAISYLFPSGLFEKKARPLMKPPEEVFPQRKAAEFDLMGRPHHFLFYTGKPNFYKLLYDIVERVNECNRYEDAMNRKSIQRDPNLVLEMSGYQWLDKDALEKQCVEGINDKEYNNFKDAMERLTKLPYSYKVKDFIMEYSRPLMMQTKTHDVPELQYDKDGKAFITTYECLRKRARADVTVSSPGTGKITINGEGINYFDDIHCREQLLFPLIFTNLHKNVDVVANVEGGGPAGQAGAIRWGIAWSLRSFVDQEIVEKMRIAGLLTRDYRIRERKKPGQAGARKKFTWKKR
ncbi:PREDICTED: 28S ribosomal protein S9, mitochondrial [Nicrophorus vespilloides]|uniref:28S ribosomal protein S9, mitochondrial n=1 Tax=Nicrophorus vespilloides TaxID=110193 RepID=A0ABM1MKL7_NICVS|nr:PREDICTED: 28S ribosomal protein S9, mitochondrial [Nicrophorus vespilloides]